VFGLYSRWFHRYALLAGWAAAMLYGTVTAYSVVNPVTGKNFGGAVADIPLLGGQTGYIALSAFALNVLVAVLGTLLLRAARVPSGTDATARGDYLADAGDPRVSDLPEVVRGEPPGFTPR
jgi:SSS family solute:Na+ symporter